MIDSDWENTLEQLQNRLGKNAIRYLNVQDEINPEWAWSYQSTLSILQRDGTAMRPLWLLNVPKPLKLYKNKPAYGGPLIFLQGPERIQSGWWRGDEQSIRRDYYIVASCKAGYLWIYRDLKRNAKHALVDETHQNNQWYLHGFFG
jgi:protein ImuB